MPSVFLVSDTHFGHAGVCRFTRSDGVTKLRPWTDPDEMDEFMIQAWNDRVREVVVAHTRMLLFLYRTLPGFLW